MSNTNIDGKRIINLGSCAQATKFMVGYDSLRWDAILRILAQIFNYYS